MAPLRRLLYMCEYPPSTVAGAPVILRQLLSHYDPGSLEVLCCGDHYPTDDPLIRASHLACNHTTIPRMQPWDLRPRRLFVPLWDTLNLLRIPRIVAAGRELVDRRNLEAILTVPWRCDFALAALRLARETGLPLYVYETDDWEAMNSSLLPGRLVRRNHGPLLREAERAWLISPAMIERYRERFGVDGSFLFHSVDVDRYRRAIPARGDRRSSSSFSIVYTGSINQMFHGAMKAVAELVQEGLEVAGRPVELHIYGASCPSDLLGPSVIWHGLVDSEEIPGVLAAADVLLLGVTFSDRPELVELVKTCIYTKTVDYLAADRPLLIVGPPYAAEVKHFRDVATVVDSPAPERINRALEQIAAAGADVQERRRRGLELVRRHHSSEVVTAGFLDAFRKQAA